MPFIFVIRLRRIALIFIEVYRATVSLLEACVIKVVCRIFVAAAESHGEKKIYTYIYIKKNKKKSYEKKRQKRKGHALLVLALVWNEYEHEDARIYIYIYMIKELHGVNLVYYARGNDSQKQSFRE